MKKLKKHFFSKLAKLHKRNSDRPQMYNLKGISSDGKVVEFPYISADKCGVINIKGLPVGTYKFTEVINEHNNNNCKPERVKNSYTLLLYKNYGEYSNEKANQA